VSTPVRVVCFDWGGVIVRICREWHEGCARAGLGVREADLGPEHLAQRQSASDAYHIGAIGCDEFCRRLAVSTGGAYTPEEVRRIHDVWLIEEFAGVAGLVDELNSLARITTGLLSNTNAAHWAQHMPSDNGEPLFPTIARLVHKVASHTVGAAKPSQAIYRAFEAVCGEQGDSILFFDDLAANIRAARSIGWRAELIDATGDPAAQMRVHLHTHGVL